MKVFRVRPGQYEVRRGGILVGLIERSHMMPWMWWWSAWDESTAADGTSCRYGAARAALLAALRDHRTTS